MNEYIDTDSYLPEDVEFGTKQKQKAEKDLNRQMFFLKIKMFFLKLMHFPTLLLDFLKYSLFSLTKLWGIVLLWIMILFLYLTDSYTVIYYKVLISLERNTVESVEKSIILKEQQLKIANNNMSCYQNQFKRIADNMSVKIWFCKK